MAKRITRVTIETNSLTILRSREHTPLRWCPACETQTRAVTVELAARICSVTQRVILRLVEVDRLHFHEMPTGEMPTGELLICAESLRRLAEEATQRESP